MLVYHIDGHHFEYAIVKWDFDMKMKKIYVQVWLKCVSGCPFDKDSEFVQLFLHNRSVC